MQPQSLEMLEQDPAVPVDDGLRGSRGPRGEQHIEGMVERHLLEYQFGRFRPGARPSRRRHRPRPAPWGAPRRWRSPRRTDRPLCRRSGSRVSANSTTGSSWPNRSITLRRSELRRTRCPDGPEAGGGQKGDQGLRSVRQVGHHAVPRARPLTWRRPFRQRPTSWRSWSQRELALLAGLGSGETAIPSPSWPMPVRRS